jgi:concanavalin A-like lectin/glucanase superfamily protein
MAHCGRTRLKTRGSASDVQCMPRKTTAAAVAATAVLVLPPVAAQARTEHFAPTDNVRVDLRLTGSAPQGTLVRFGRNGVSLTRGPDGTLTLHAGRRRSRSLAAPARRPVVVRVVLSVRIGRVRAAVGGRAIRLAGPFVGESEVVTRGARADVHRSPATVPGAGAAKAAMTGAPAAVTRAPAPGAATPSVPARVGSEPTPSRTTVSAAGASTLFAPTSVWNAPLSDTAPIDPSSASLVKTLTDTVAQNISAGWGPWIETKNTSSYYVVPADQPTVRVAFDASSWKATLQQAFEAVPIPPDAVPGGGPDAHMTIYQPSTDRMWELFQASRQADGWHASFGGAMTNVSTSPGYYDAASWPGLSGSFWGATATSLPVIAGTMMISELKAGVIPHALAMNIPYALPKTYSWPAQRTDGTSTDPNAIPEGARFRLDPKLDIDALNLPPMTRMMAKAAQRYGIVVRDQTAHAISFFAENPNQQPADPYVGTTGFFGGQYPNPVMKAFPWSSLRLLKTDLRPAAPTVTTTAATAITSAGATLGASVNAHSQSTTFRFEYGPTTAYGATTVSQSVSTADDDPHAVTMAVSALSPGQTYHYRVVATNATGTTTGADGTFATPAVLGTGYRELVLATSGLAAYWRLGDATGRVAADETAANPGVYAGAVTLGEPGALAATMDTSAGFDGVTGEMTANARGLGTTGTIEGWFDWRRGVALMRDNTGIGGWILAFDNGGKLAYRVAGTTYDTGRTVASVQGAWHHVAITKNGAAVAFYLDGNLIHSGTGAGTTAPVMPWHVMRNGTAPQYATGHADDVAVYTTVLPAAAISQRFGVGRGG